MGGAAFERALEAARRLFREEIALLIGRLEAEACDEAAAKSFARAARSWGDGWLRDIRSA